MTYEELLISIDLNGYENVLPKIGMKYLDSKYLHWFVVCDDGDCHLFNRFGKEDDISKIKEINEGIIPKDIKKIVIPNSVTSIGECAFYYCSELKKVTIPNSVTCIGDYAFKDCSNLKSAKIPDSVMRIGNGTFADCSRLMNMTIPSNVTIIWNYAFARCNSLISMTILSNVINIGKNTFYNCSNLKSLIFKGKSLDQIKSMKNYPFGIEDESIIKCIC